MTDKMIDNVEISPQNINRGIARTAADKKYKIFGAMFVGTGILHGIKGLTPI